MFGTATLKVSDVEHFFNRVRLPKTGQRNLTRCKPDIDPPACRRRAAPYPRILLAEDDPRMRALTYGTLRKAGYDVTECRSSIDMLQCLENEGNSAAGSAFDLVITDLPMPRMEAFELFDAIDLRHNCPPVILVTELNDEGIYTRAEQSGVTAVLKPSLNADDFLEQIHQIMRNKPAAG